MIALGRVVSSPVMRKPRIVSVGVYERVVRASLERVWENVLDWEHLPGLHRESFVSIRRIDSGDWGWTAQLRTPGAAREMTIQVVLERESLRYITATIEGPGKGTEIWTTLAPKSEEETGIRVEFLVPDVSPERITTLGAGYRALYTRLWDEDEAMMRRRAKWLARLRGPKPEHGATLDLGPRRGAAREAACGRRARRAAMADHRARGRARRLLDPLSARARAARGGADRGGRSGVPLASLPLRRALREELRWPRIATFTRSAGGDRQRRPIQSRS